MSIDTPITAAPKKPIRPTSKSKGTGKTGLALLLIPAALLIWQLPAFTAHSETVIDPPAVTASSRVAGTETALLAGGCFWGVQAVFQHLEGVTSVISGYVGGSPDNATYRAVSSGRTDHAEAVKITYDPTKISYGKILQVYFSVAHDPTQINRQGPDVGAQYRSAIFAGDDDQRRVAQSYIAQLNGSGAFKRPLATTVNAEMPFYPAEAYHQDYAFRNPGNPYIARNDLPKVDSLKKLFPNLYIDTPTLVLASR